MKTCRLVLTLICLSAVRRAQDNTDLSAYLQQHRYAIQLDDPNTFAMLPALMGTHNVLFVAEVHHNLRLYDTLRTAITTQLQKQHLRTELIEYGHSMAYLYNQYLAGDDAIAMQFQPAALVPYRPFRRTGIRIAGLDFETPDAFSLAIKSILTGFDKTRLSETKDFITLITDSSHKEYSEKRFSTFYKQVSAAFTTQDAALRKELGERYDGLKYLCTNPNATTRFMNRNPALANNFIREVTPFDTTATYYCQIGGTHADFDDKQSMINILNGQEGLKGKMIVMTTYCDNYRDGADRVSDEKWLHLAKGNLLSELRNAASGRITLFDLSGLPDRFISINHSGTLLLFVRNQE